MLATIDRREMAGMVNVSVSKNARAMLQRMHLEKFEVKLDTSSEVTKPLEAKVQVELENDLAIVTIMLNRSLYDRIQGQLSWLGYDSMADLAEDAVRLRLEDLLRVLLRSEVSLSRHSQQTADDCNRVRGTR